MKKCRSLLAFLLMLCFLCSCGNPTEEDEQKKINLDPNEAKYANFTLPYLASQTLDPITCPDGVQEDLTALVFEGLFHVDGSYQLCYDLCESYEVKDNQYTFVFTLAAGRQFSDGSAVTASDAVASIQRAKASPRYERRLSTIWYCRALNDLQFQVIVSTANSRLPYLLDIPIVKAGSENETYPIGSGPYAYGMDEDEQFQLQRNSYWTGEAPTLDHFNLYGVEKQETLSTRLNAGNIQLLSDELLSAQALNYSSSFPSKEVDTLQLLYIGFNPYYQFSVAENRKLISLGCNRAQLVNAYFNQHATATQFPYSPNASYYPKDLEQEFNYASYEDAIQNSYLNATTTVVTLLVNSENSYRVTAAQYLASSLTSGNLIVSVRSLPWDEYQQALAMGDYNLYLGEVRLTADGYLSPFLSSQGAYNPSRIWDEMWEAYMANQFVLEEDFSSYIREVCTYFKECVPIVPLCFTYRTIMYQQNVVSLEPALPNAPYSSLLYAQYNLKK